MPEETALYRLYDKDQDLLYVGISNNPQKRWTNHASLKTWWNLVVHKEVQWFTSREAAEKQEREAVERERPRFDATHRSGGNWRTTPRVSYADPRLPAIEAYLREDVETDHDGLFPKSCDLARQLRASVATVNNVFHDLQREGVVRWYGGRWYDASNIRRPGVQKRPA